MSNIYARRRTIAMPEYRARQIAKAAAKLGITSEAFIQSAISVAIEHGDALASALMRAGGTA